MPFLVQSFDIKSSSAALALPLLEFIGTKLSSKPTLSMLEAPRWFLLILFGGGGGGLDDVLLWMLSMGGRGLFRETVEKRFINGKCFM